MLVFLIIHFTSSQFIITGSSVKEAMITFSVATRIVP